MPQSSTSGSCAGIAALLVIMLCACAALALCCSHASIVFCFCFFNFFYFMQSTHSRSIHVLVFKVLSHYDFLCFSRSVKGLWVSPKWDLGIGLTVCPSTPKSSGRDRRKMRLYSNCWNANTMDFQKHMHILMSYFMCSSVPYMCDSCQSSPWRISLVLTQTTYMPYTNCMARNMVGELYIWWIGGLAGIVKF